MQYPDVRYLNLEAVDMGLNKFTEREQQIIALRKTGLSFAEIANRLGLAIKTVYNHNQAIYEKLGIEIQSR